MNHLERIDARLWDINSDDCFPNKRKNITDEENGDGEVILYEKEGHSKYLKKFHNVNNNIIIWIIITVLLLITDTININSKFELLA